MQKNSRKRILFMLQFPPPVHGSSMVGQMIRESNVINQEFESNYINLLASHNVAETGKFSLKKLVEFVVIWFKTLVSIVFKRPNLVYFALTTTGMAFLRDVLLVALLKLFHLKRIYHLHNKGIKNYEDNPFFRPLYKFVFKNSEVILLSKCLYEDVKTFVPELKVRICPNGISDIFSELLKDEATKTENEMQKVPEILFLSNLIESKGVSVLLEACKLLEDRNIDFRCTFIGGEGDITATEFNKKTDSLDLGNKVQFKGKKFRADKIKAFREADIFVFPTYYSKECFPLVLLEAMAASLPVISTFEGGIPDIIDNGINGFVVEQQNVEMLAKQMELLLTNPVLRKEMGVLGRKKFEREFELNIFEYKLTEILNASIANMKSA